MKYLCTDALLETTDGSRRFATESFFLLVSVSIFIFFKQAFVAKFEALSKLFMEELKKTKKCCRIEAVWNQTSALEIKNTKQEN